MIFTVVISIMVLYMLRIGMYRHYWNRFPVFENTPEQPLVGISVVIAFRNEENSLPWLLSSLYMQGYPEALREVILVNDHSDDRSLHIVREFARAHTGFHCLCNEEDEQGKKAAVMKGIRHSTFSFIAVTDADCRMGNDWLSTMAAGFGIDNARMVIGLVDMDAKPGLFSRFQEIEFLSLVASGAGAAAGGKPIYCNAANLAFDKDLFLSYGDPLSVSVPSGDDTLFMLRVKEDCCSRIVLMKSSAGIVTTRGTANIREFFSQRSRWASKSRHYTDRDILYTAGLVLAVSLALVYSGVQLAAGKNLWLFPLLLLSKSAVDFLFLNDFLHFFGKKIKPLLFLIFETIYPVYILISASMGLFERYSWKKRNYGPAGT